MGGAPNGPKEANELEATACAHHKRTQDRERQDRQTTPPEKPEPPKTPPKKERLQGVEVRLVELTAQVDTKVYSPGQTGPGRSL